jgi:phthalate 4,5-cis-dihydrodiol dehydrogenase
MNEIRIGVIGSGFMGRTNAETIARYLKGATLAGIAGGTRAAALAKEYGVEAAADVPSLLARTDVDAVFISTPHAQHAEHAVAAAEAGKHILLDKPMAASVAECDRIIAAAAGAGVNVMIMFGQRFRKVNSEAYRLIQEGAIGTVRQIHAYALNSGGLASLPAWQSEPENLGTLFGHGIHNIDLVRWLTGKQVLSVAAEIQRESPSNNEVSTMAVLGLEGGAMATVWVSWTIPAPGIPHSAFSARVVGDTGILDLDAYGVLRLGRNGAWTSVVEQAPIDFKGKGMLDPVRLEAYAAQGTEFLNSIRERRRPAVTGEDGRAAVQIALAAYQSAAEQRKILLLMR